jgi:hypothetical protein
MPYGTVNADVIQTSTSGGILGAGNASIMKNRIINGANVISQRGTSFSLSTGIGTYTTDRWAAYLVTSGATATVSQSTSAPVGFNNSLLYTVGTGAALGATDFNTVFQKIEGFNVADMGFGTANAKTFTLSFWAKSSITGTYGVTFRNDAGDRSYGATYTISAANTWEYKSVTVAGDTSGTWTTNNSCGLMITFGVGVGSTYSISAGSWQSAGGWGVTGATNIVATSGATWSMTGVQLEVGSSATGFEYVNYQTSLANCQRYYQQSYAPGTVAGTATSVNQWYGGSFATSSTATYGSTVPFLVEMRATPTVLAYNDSGTSSRVSYAYGSGTSGSSAPTYFATGTRSFGVYHGGASGLTTGNAVELFCQFTATAEL